MYRRWIRIILLLALVPLCSVSGAQQNIYYILDASGSMWGRMEGQSKIAIAKSVLADRIPSLAESDLRVGLIVYGHRRKGDCSDIEEVVPLQPVQQAGLLAAIESIVPKGKTPIAGAIRMATDRLRVLEEDAHIVLISDGLETCDPDPCATVRRLKDLGIGFTVDVIGFDLRPEEHERLKCIAEASDGKYYPASSAEELHEAILQAETIPLPPKVPQNIEIILDRSRQMEEPFGQRRKIDVAVEGLRGMVLRPGAAVENIAFRTFGGACGRPDNTRLEEALQVDNGAAIGGALDAVTLGGEATLASALKRALDDFKPPARFEGVNNRVVIVAGGRGSCDPREAEKVYRKFKDSNIKPDFWYIAMDVPPDEMQELKRVVGASAGRLLAVQTQEEFDRALDRVFEIEPVITGVRAITDMLNRVVDDLNRAYQNIGGENYEAAQDHIRAGRSALAETRAQFLDLGARRTRETFRTLYELARSNRELQAQGFRLAEEMIAKLRDADDIPAYNALVGQVDGLIGEYNDNVGSINGILQRF